MGIIREWCGVTRLAVLWLLDGVPREDVPAPREMVRFDPNPAVKRLGR